MNKYLRLLILALIGLWSVQLFAGNLTVTLSPSQAISAGAKWRVDGGTWRNSGTTVKNLSNTTHTVDFKSVSGWLTPVATTVTITNGNTATLTGTYVQPASLKISLTPTTGQWRIDGGAWQSSGATVTGLAPGGHTVDYAAVAGYSLPATETVTLVANQTTTLARSYTQLAQLSIALVPTSGQWRVNGGAWQNSGATVANLAPGNHTVEYSTLAVPNWGTPPTETVSLAAGQSLSLTRSYATLGQVMIGLVPATGTWRLNGGAWQASGNTLWVPAGTYTIDYSALADYDPPPPDTFVDGFLGTRYYTSTKPSLRVHLVPSAGQWRIDGGAWQVSGAQVTGLATGSHTLDYTELGGDYNSLASETISLAPRENAILSRSYPQKPATLTVNLSPASGQWLLNGPTASVWRNSGDTVTGLMPASNYTIQYSSQANYLTPPTESLALSPNQSVTLTRAYVAVPAQVTVTLTPASGQWRIYPAQSAPSGTWQNSGATVASLAPGSYAIEYSALGGYAAPATETVTLTAGQSAAYSRNYTVLPAQLTITTAPASGQWRIYPDQTPPSGNWNASGAMVANIAPGAYVIAYSTVQGYHFPSENYVALAPGESKTIAAAYYPIPPQITITLEPSSAQWRIDGGAWQASGACATGLAVGSHLVEFSAVAGYTTPPAHTVELGLGDALNKGVIYSVQSPAKILVNLTPSSAQWRVDGGAWLPAGTAAADLLAGSHLLEFSSEPGFATPLSQTISLNAGDSRSVSFLYTPLTPGLLSVKTTPATAQWRVDGGAWNDSGVTLGGLATGAHSLEFAAVPGYVTPMPTSVQVNATEVTRLDWTYSSGYAGVRITLNPAQGRFRIDGGAWANSGASAWSEAGVAHFYEYEPIAGYITPPAEYIKVGVAGQSLSLTRTYQAIATATVSVGLNLQQGQWRIYSGASPSGAWQLGSATVMGLAPGSYTIEYAAIMNYGSPTTETLTLAASQEVVLNRAYLALPGQVTVTTTPANAQWRISPVGGPASTIWLASGASVPGLVPGSYYLEYAPVADYSTPYGETLVLGSAEAVALTRNYRHNLDLSISLNPYTAQWRIDGGAWLASGDGVWNLASGSHLIEYKDLPGYVSPSAETVVFTSGQPLTLYRYYTPLAQLTVSLTPYTAQWRVDGGAWQASGATVANLAFNVPHTVEYAPAAGYVAPPSEAVTLYSGEQRQFSRSYTPLAQLTVSLYPFSAQWRVDGGAWQASGATVANLAFDMPHMVEYAPAVGYVAPSSETVTLYSGEQRQFSRSYSPLAQLTVSLYPFSAQWRVDGGAWQASGATVANLAFDVPHLIEYRAHAGYSTPSTQSVTLFSGQSLPLFTSYTSLGILRLRFFVHPDLIGSLPIADVRSRLAQYAAHVTQVFSRETLRVFLPFDPLNDVTVAAADPFSGTISGGWLPNSDFELWVYATATDNPSVGTYGGSVGVDSSGAGGVRELRWDQIHDPSSLANGTPALAQYWRQLHLILRGFERAFQAGAGDYASLGGLHDASGVVPVLADVADVDSATPDAFWNARFDYWSDPLTANAHANPRLGSPMALSTLLDITSFAPATRGVINGPYRNASSAAATLPDLTAVVVKVVNAQTGLPITGSTLRVWNRQNPVPPNDTYEETVTAAGPAGLFSFRWTGAPVPLNSAENAKLIKAFAPGYTPAAQWITVYDAQKARLIDGKSSLEITIALTPL
ncbi:MAG: hypothetical protein HZA31_06135 [Opitutae bacterium]|nr:hypothetical protein [Opitutae bacterium]